MTSETRRTTEARRSGASSHGSGAGAGEEPRAQPLFRRPLREARLWLTGVAVLVGAAVLALAVVRQGEQAAAQQRAANHWYAHTLEVLVEVGRFSTALSETERGALGYVLTGDPQFLSSYALGLRSIPDSLRRIRILTADNAGQQRRLAALAEDAAEVILLSEQEVRQEAAGRHDAALSLIRSTAAHVAAERAQAASTAIAVEERGLLALRHAAAVQATRDSARLTIALAILGGALLMAAGVLGWVAFASAARARLAALHADAQGKLAASAALLAVFIAETPAAIAMFDRQMRYVAVSRRYLADYGLPAVELKGRSHYEVFPEIPQRWRDIHASVLAGETRSCDEDFILRGDGRVDWVRWRMQPWRDSQGEVGGALLFSEVITAEVEAQRAHLAAEARLRAIVETAVDAIIVIDEAGVIQSANPATKTLFGYAAEELVGRNVSLLMPEPHRSAHDGYLAAYLRTGERKIIGAGREVEGLRKDGSIMPIDLAVAEWRIEGRRFFTGLIRDASLRKAAEAQRLQAERRELVVGELRHRINNMFFVIHGLVAATARSHSDVGAYRDSLLARLSAFAAAQAELARRSWSSLGLRELVDFELKPYTEDGKRVTLEGLDLRLSGAAAESLAMVIHELATNAAKYGALSRPEAALRLDWALIPTTAGETRFVLSWVERGGPPVAPPQRRGFGSTVIESGARALGGTARLDYAPEGLNCTIDVPAARVLLPAGSEPERLH